VIAQLSKYFWVVGSFRGVPSGDAFAKWYELHYQPKKIEIDEGTLFVQYSCLNFHAKRDDGPKLSLAVKNKWSSGWTKAWFYCRVPCLRNSEVGKSMYALRSRMNALDYTVEHEVERLYSNVNNAAFVRATATVRGCDAVEEFLACGMYPLPSSFSFRDIMVDMTAMSKVKTPLPLFPIEAVSMEDAGHFLAKVETDVERILGSYGPK
jgi:hypothetical protein